PHRHLHSVPTRRSSDLLIRRDKWRTPVWIAGLGDKFVFLPSCVAVDDRVVGSFKDNFVAFAPDDAERAVGVDEIEPAEGVIHQLDRKSTRLNSSHQIIS